ncbi:hypothetical protein DFH09DRAFT_1089429 [Mycena vulgaris]|nr:hypothetical protein DFH09DRAFT_1089429 [Mycena vulgaris]
MSSPNTSEKLDKLAVTNKEKRSKRAETQRKYRERNLEATREKARERMSRLRKRKFVAEFGEDAFFDYYLVHQWLLAVDHLPGVSHQYRKDLANAPEAHRADEEGDA